MKCVFDFVEGVYIPGTVDTFNSRMLKIQLITMMDSNVLVLYEGANK